MQKILLSSFKLFFPYMIDMKNKSCVIYLHIYVEYHAYSHVKYLYMYIR